MSVPCGSDLSHCYYRGSVLGDPISSAVFDLCNGLVSCSCTLIEYAVCQEIIDGPVHVIV